MIKQLVERIKKFIKDHIVDEDPCNGCDPTFSDIKLYGRIARSLDLARGPPSGP